MSTSFENSTLLAAPTSSASDTFDAIVQAANPSHPNHAAWVEKFGGSLPRRAGTRGGGGGIGGEEYGSGGGDHLEQSDSSHRRRRRGSSNTGSSRAMAAAIKASQSRLDSHNPTNGNGFGVGHSRAHTSAVDGGPLLRSGKSSELEDYISPIRDSRRTSEDVARKRKKKRPPRDKGKGPIAPPPIPPPRTTSQMLHFPNTPEMTTSPLQAYPPSYHSHSSVFHGGGGGGGGPPTFMESPQAPGTFSSHSRNHSNQSRMTSTSYTPSPSYTFPRSSPGQNDLVEPASATITNVSSSMRGPRSQGKFHEPPTRLSSMLSRAGEIDDEQQLTTKAIMTNSNSPTQTVSSHTVSVSRNGSIRHSVEFALPEETARRGSLDSYGIRKSFDVFVSPFRGGKKATTSRKGLTTMMNKGNGIPSPPILKSPSNPTDYNARPGPPSPIFNYPFSSGPLSSVTDEGNNLYMPSRTNQVAEMAKMSNSRQQNENQAGIHPFTLSPSRVIKGVETMTEEKEDFHDARSDEGGNGSSAEDHGGGHRSNGTLSTMTKKKAKRKTPDYHNATRSRAQSTASGLGVEGIATSPLEEKTRAIKGQESSVSENDDAQEATRSSLQMSRQPVPASVGEAERVRLPKEREQLPFNSVPLSRRERTHVQTSLSTLNTLSPDDAWKERYGAHRTQLTSPSNPSLSQIYREDSAISPISSDLGHENKSQDSSTLSNRGNGRGFASVMARMRRDRTPSTNALKSSSSTMAKNDAIEGGDYLETGSSASVTAAAAAAAAAAPFGLGIATPGADNSVETPQKKWRNRLTSFSTKSTKSPKVEEDSRMEFMEASPIPPMPAKAMKMLIAKTIPESSELDRIRNHNHRQVLLDNASNQSVMKGSQTAPMESREFKIKAENLNQISSPTIHKTLSPALLTERHHEADEVVSFIGSEDDGLDKRETWNSLSNFELPPHQVADEMRDQIVEGGGGERRIIASSTVPVNLHITRPSMDLDLYRQDALQDEPEYKDVRKSFTARRFSFGKPKLSSRASDGGLRKGSSSTTLFQVSPPPPPPLPVTSSRGGGNTSLPMGDDGIQNSPFSRASMDHRRPSWSRVKSRPSLASPSTTTRGASLALDRERTTFEYQRSPSTPFRETFASPKSGNGKRFFSVGVKSKNQSKGISSNDFAAAAAATPYQLGSSKSEVSLGSSSAYRRREGDEDINGIDDVFGQVKKASNNLTSQMDNLAISSPPSSSSLPPTPIVPQHVSTKDEEAAFDKFLRESTKEDVARVKEIAIRTAQHAQFI